MLALSIHQPWAWAILHGPKRVENRCWRTNHRGPLLIHAAMNRRSLGPAAEILAPLVQIPLELPFGAIVGVVNVDDCVRPDAVAPDQIALACGPWCWLLSDPRPLVEPIPLRGLQRLFQVPFELGDLRI